MSLRRVDARFLLPELPARAAVLGELDGWREGLEQAGVELQGPPDLAVAPGALGVRAASLGAALVLLEGNGVGSLGRAGYRTRRVLALPRPADASLFVPLDDRAVVRYALERWRVPARRWHAVRNRVAAELLARAGRALPSRLVTVAAKAGTQPLFVAATRDLGVPGDAGWFFATGQGHELARGVFQLFERGASTPAWALKFARVPGYSLPFDRDQEGLELAQSAGPAIARRAPRLVGRFEVGGFHASVETAAVGRRLTALLAGPAPRPRKLGLVEQVADWALELARSTRAPAEVLDPLRRQLAEQIVPPWIERGAPADLVARLDPLPASLVHHDLGAWNIVVADNQFTVLDWESARRHGPPLWDLVYFIADALAVCDRAETGPAREQHFSCLFRGELLSSSLLFRWLRLAVEALELTPEAVGPLLTLLWLYEGSPIGARDAAAERLIGEPAPHGRQYERLAAAWLADPELGPGWSGWR